MRSQPEALSEGPERSRAVSVEEYAPWRIAALFRSREWSEKGESPGWEVGGKWRQAPVDLATVSFLPLG